MWNGEIIKWQMNCNRLKRENEKKKSWCFVCCGNKWEKVSDVIGWVLIFSETWIEKFIGFLRSSSLFHFLFLYLFPPPAKANGASYIKRKGKKKIIVFYLFKMSHVRHCFRWERRKKKASDQSFWNQPLLPCTCYAFFLRDSETKRRSRHHQNVTFFFVYWRNRGCRTSFKGRVSSFPSIIVIYVFEKPKHFHHEVVPISIVRWREIGLDIVH